MYDLFSKYVKYFIVEAIYEKVNRVKNSNDFKEKIFDEFSIYRESTLDLSGMFAILKEEKENILSREQIKYFNFMSDINRENDYNYYFGERELFYKRIQNKYKNELLNEKRILKKDLLFTDYYGTMIYIIDTSFYNREKYNREIEQDIINTFGFDLDIDDEEDNREYHRIKALIKQEFFIELYDFLVNECLITFEKIKEDFDILKKKRDEEYAKEKEIISNMNCICSLDNGKKIFNFICGCSCCNQINKIKYNINIGKERDYIDFLKENLFHYVEQYFYNEINFFAGYKDYSKYVVTYKEKYVYYDTKDSEIYLCDYPAFFIEVDVEKINRGFLEAVNFMKSFTDAKKVLDKFLEKHDFSSEDFELKYAFEIYPEFKNNDKIFDLLYNSNFKELNANGSRNLGKTKLGKVNLNFEEY